MNRRHLAKSGLAAMGGLATVGAIRSGTSAKTVVSYGTPGSEVEDAAFKPVFDAFNESQDEIEARYVALGGNYGPEYLQNLQARIAAGNAPDLFFLPVQQIAGWASRNVISPLDDLVSAAGLDLSIHWPAHIEALQYQDSLWGIPRDGAPNALYYNADLFDAAGIPYPDETWDWAKHLEVATALTKRDDSGRAEQIGTGRGGYASWVWQNGGDILNADNTACTLDQPEAIEALQWAQDLVITHKVAPSESDLADQDEADMFLAGRLAMHFAVRGFLGSACKADFRFSAAVVPSGKVRMTHTAVGPTVLWTGSKNPDAAFKFMQFMCGPDGQRLKIQDTGFAFPSIKALTEEEWFTTFKCGQSLDDGVSLSFVKEIQEGWTRGLPQHPKWPEIEVAITEQLDALYLGEKTGDQVGKDIAAAVNPLLAS